MLLVSRNSPPGTTVTLRKRKLYVRENIVYFDSRLPSGYSTIVTGINEIIALTPSLQINNSFSQASVTVYDSVSYLISEFNKTYDTSTTFTNLVIEKNPYLVKDPGMVNFEITRDFNTGFNFNNSPIVLDTSEVFNIVFDTRDASRLSQSPFDIVYDENMHKVDQSVKYNIVPDETKYRLGNYYPGDTLVKNLELFNFSYEINQPSVYSLESVELPGFIGKYISLSMDYEFAWQGYFIDNDRVTYSFGSKIINNMFTKREFVLSTSGITDVIRTNNPYYFKPFTLNRDKLFYNSDHFVIDRRISYKEFDSEIIKQKHFNLFKTDVYVPISLSHESITSAIFGIKNLYYTRFISTVQDTFVTENGNLFNVSNVIDYDTKFVENISDIFREYNLNRAIIQPHIEESSKFRTIIRSTIKDTGVLKYEPIKYLISGLDQNKNISPVNITLEYESNNDPFIDIAIEPISYATFFLAQSLYVVNNPFYGNGKLKYFNSLNRLPDVYEKLRFAILDMKHIEELIRPFNLIDIKNKHLYKTKTEYAKSITDIINSSIDYTHHAFSTKYRYFYNTIKSVKLGIGFDTIQHETDVFKLNEIYDILKISSIDVKLFNLSKSDTLETIVHIVNPVKNQMVVNSFSDYHRLIESITKNLVADNRIHQNIDYTIDYDYQYHDRFNFLNISTNANILLEEIGNIFFDKKPTYSNIEAGIKLSTDSRYNPFYWRAHPLHTSGYEFNKTGHLKTELFELYKSNDNKTFFPITDRINFYHPLPIDLYKDTNIKLESFSLYKQSIEKFGNILPGRNRVIKTELIIFNTHKNIKSRFIDFFRNEQLKTTIFNFKSYTIKKLYNQLLVRLSNGKSLPINFETISSGIVLNLAIDRLFGIIKNGHLESEKVDTHNKANVIYANTKMSPYSSQVFPKILLGGTSHYSSLWFNYEGFKNAIVYRKLTTMVDGVLALKSNRNKAYTWLRTTSAYWALKGKDVESYIRTFQDMERNLNPFIIDLSSNKVTLSYLNSTILRTFSGGTRHKSIGFYKHKEFIIQNRKNEVQREMSSSIEIIIDTLSYKKVNLFTMDEVPHFSKNYKWMLEPVVNTKIPMKIFETDEIRTNRPFEELLISRMHKSGNKSVVGMFGDVIDYYSKKNISSDHHVANTENDIKVIEEPNILDRHGNVLQMGNKYVYIPIKLYAINTKLDFMFTYNVKFKVSHNFSIDRDRDLIFDYRDDNTVSMSLADKFKYYINMGWISLSDYDGYITYDKGTDKFTVHDDIVKELELISNSQKYVGIDELKDMLENSLRNILLKKLENK